MKKFDFDKTKRMITAVGAMTLLSAACLAATQTQGFCDDSDGYSMAPPVASQDAPSNDQSDSATASTVFNWQEVPANQDVSITRAVFDQGGYQLYDTQGETIVVPFKNDNLYVMKFAVSHNGDMYFVNSGTAPILYVPDGGYLENATVPGAKWYPFTDNFQPSTPVFLGVAPSWDDYCNIGWYPDMYCYGGYWCGEPYGVGVFEPSFGLFIAFGGHHFDGWGGYVGFAGLYPAPYSIGFFDRGVYGFAGRQYWGGRTFHGYGGYARNSGGGNFYGGGYRSYGAGFGAGQHVFRGAAGYGGGYHGGFGGSGSYHGFPNGSSNGFHGGNFGDGGFHGGGFHGGSFGDGGLSGGGGFRGGNFSGGGSHGGSFGGGSFHSGGFSGGHGGGGFSGGDHHH